VGDLDGRHKIRLTTQNVQSLRLYLNDQLVDLSQSVAVYVNGKERFEGIIPTSIDEMLKDENFMGRGMRYYTAVLDLDLTAVEDEATTEPSTKPVKHGSIEVTMPDGTKKVYGGSE